MPPPVQKGITRRRQADRRAETRRKLLDAAVTSLVENGFAGTTVDTIASAAGVTRGALNHHFDSKIELMLAAAGRVTEIFADRLTSRIERLAGPDPYESALRSLWEAIYREPMFVARLELLLGARSQAEIVGKIKAEHLRGHLMVHQLLSDAFERSGSSLSLSQEVLDLALATLRGLALEMIVRQDADFADRQLRLLADAVRGLLSARPKSAG